MQRNKTKHFFFLSKNNANESNAKNNNDKSVNIHDKNSNKVYFSIQKEENKSKCEEKGARTKNKTKGNLKQAKRDDNVNGYKQTIKDQKKTKKGEKGRRAAPVQMFKVLLPLIRATINQEAI